MSDNITYSAMVGELRKAARLFEVFKNAAEIAEVLSNYEADKKNLLRDIKKLEAEKVDLDSACDEAYNKQQIIEAEVVKADNTKVEILKKARTDANAIIKEAKDKGKGIVDKANEKLAGIEAKINKALEDAVKADAQKQTAIKALHKYQTQVKEVKENLLKSFES